MLYHRKLCRFIFYCQSHANLGETITLPAQADLIQQKAEPCVHNYCADYFLTKGNMHVNIILQQDQFSFGRFILKI